MTYRYFGIFAFCMLAIGLWFITKKWPYDTHHTFSQHVARHKSAILFYVLLFVIALIPLNIFFITWLVPTYNISHWFIWLTILSSITQIGCTLIPETGGAQTKIHQALAGLSAISLIPALIILAFSCISFTNTIIATISLLTMVLVVAFVVQQKDLRKHLLFAQIFYFGAFFLPILSISL